MTNSLFGELDLESIAEVPYDGVHAGVIRAVAPHTSQAGNTSLKFTFEFTDEDDEFYGEKFYKYLSVNPELDSLDGEAKVKALSDIRKYYLPFMRNLDVPEDELLNPDLESLVGLRVLINGKGRDRRDGQGKEWVVYSAKADN